jgi:hypothetical protein
MDQRSTEGWLSAAADAPAARLGWRRPSYFHNSDVIHSLLIDDLTFSGRWSRRRRMIGISVGAAGELRAAAPVGCPQAVLEAAVRDKLIWVRKKLAEQEVRAAEQIRAYEAGELFPYLGFRYPLQLVDDPELAVQLHGGRFEFDRGLVHDGRAQMSGLQLRGMPCRTARHAGLRITLCRAILADQKPAARGTQLPH